MSVEHTQDNRCQGALRVERAIVELRRGRGIEIADNGCVSRIAAVETLDPLQVPTFAGPDGVLRLILTGERAHALGLRAKAGGVEIRLPASARPGQIAALAGLEEEACEQRLRLASAGKANRRAAAGCRLAGYGRLLPAVLYTEDPAPPAHTEHLRVSISDIEAYTPVRGMEVVRVSRARVPLLGDNASEVILYRERYADAEHLAVVVGRPDLNSPVLLRLHSACLTGDLLGSLRCDCGDQLRGAASRMAAAGGGIVLYLAQEGRGIGLTNKLRAYALQDTGLDTLEADLHLGFRADERDYGVACGMLKDLGVERVRLLTNNPAKISALERCGIEVVGRASLPVPVNPHNARYLRTKREGAGHLDGEPEVSNGD